jgi:hypothetical protein
MSDDVFIAIVPSAGSTEPLWHGAFRFDELTGYNGKLLAIKPDFKPGPLTFDTPAELDQDALFCVIDGSNFATAIWPHFFGQKINFSGLLSRITDARFPILINSIHVGANEPIVKGFTLYSPLFALLFGLEGYTDQITLKPHKTVKIETKHVDDIKFATDLWSIKIGITGNYQSSREKLSPNLDMTGYATIEFNSKCTPIQALRLALQIEYFLSLVCLSFVSCQRLHFNVEGHDTDGQAAEKHVEVTRARHIKDAKTELNLTELPIRLKSIDVGASLLKFIKYLIRLNSH